MFKNTGEKLISKLPFGFRDIFPVEAQERKNVEEIIRKIFTLWGYGEVKTPVVEFTENISAGVGKDWKDRLISFFDVDGNLVSLRADMTIPIARLTGMRIRKEELPGRFFYLANSFRQSGLQKGQKRVISQAGLELIGSEEFFADIEVLVVLINILNKLQVKGFKIGTGHIKLIEGICEWFALSSDEYSIFKENLIANNHVAMREFLIAKNKTKAAIFMDLMEPSNKIDAKEKLVGEINNKKVADSFKYLKRVYGSLKKIGFSKYFIFDLGIIREFDYYSGLVFEIYCPDVTEKLGSGGRYDGLIKKFGFDVPATGFALDIDLVHKAIKDVKIQEAKFINAVVLFDSSADYLDAIKFAGNLRSKGISVALIARNKADMVKALKSRRVDYIYEIDWAAKKVLEVEIKSGRRKTSDLREY